MAYQHQMPQPPQPPKKRTLRTVLIVVGVVLVLCCGGAGIGGFFLYKGVKGATDPARQAAESFVSHLEAGDPDAAYELLCGDTRAGYPREAFVQGVAKEPKIRGHKVNGVNVQSVNGRTTATVRMALQLDSGFTDQHMFMLVKEDGAWKVCGQPY
ncbi:MULTISPECIES: Rv0361 family membrane protein [Micromonospora]|uniref:Rv0361 family membrane protein n=1 Tax=Micromonospora TaxID=1873 RepID=UPI00340D392E